MPPDLSIEKELWAKGLTAVAGLDEAGRGPLAGPVVAAAVVFPAHMEAVEGIDDSKKLSPEQRKKLSVLIRERSLFAIAEVTAEQIDEVNILQASLLAMRLAAEKLSQKPEFLLIDGNKKVPMDTPQRAIVKGDGKVLSIAAASILAKVHRDALMEEFARQYPAYGFEGHKGYPTISHREAIKRHGPCPIHRKTFRGVKEFLP
ncbi:MAG: ribonuclease HII [Bdellovibrionota bacterium]